MPTDRRTFLQLAAMTPAASAPATVPPNAPATVIGWPRRFTGPQLARIAFPLGGIGAGTLHLGGRGDLRDWEIFNRPDKGNAPSFRFFSIWAQTGSKKPVAKVAEARYLPPYEGSSGLGWANAPGLPRLDSAVFTGAWPLASIEFRDRRLPVRLSLEAFTPVFPLDADASGYPCAVLRYTARNPGPDVASVAMCFSLDNPAGAGEGRTAENLSMAGLRGLLFTNPALAPTHDLAGDFTVAVLGEGDLTTWRGWPRERWFSPPLLFWDQFSKQGRLDNEPTRRGTVGSVCLRREIAPGASADFTFVLAWRFPNRTPERMGWTAPKGLETTVVGNHSAIRFKSSSQAAAELARQLPALESKTRAFVQAMKDSSLPGAVKDAAMSNLSTLVSQTFFRTADGEFHGFEGTNDKSGCCYGSCSHVWNYETATAFLYPSISRSLRNAAFGHMMDPRGAIHFREMLPPGRGLSGVAAADGQMGQVMKAYLDWKLSGDTTWLKGLWPNIRKAIEFCWIKGGWDADKDGVMEGAQHNTYDVEFFGPNPQCGVYYLGGLRAAAEMARAFDDTAFAAECEQLLNRGRAWIDANLFNGEYYVQKVQGQRRDTIADKLVSTMGSDDTEQPDFQLGAGCLIDQLIGQYQADICGLGPLLDPANTRKAIAAIHRYNTKSPLGEHESVQRIFALYDESALVICDYAKAPRPRMPFPYYAEVMTGFEYAAASQMIWAGMVEQGVEAIANIRRRYDGERRNPWDEAECGHHYARAMAAWTPVVALSGFDYFAPAARLSIKPLRPGARFKCFWSAASGWGTFTLTPRTFRLDVLSGALEIAELTLPNGRRKTYSERIRVTESTPLVLS
jgi:uncharacterized protein (DUF608 family)